MQQPARSLLISIIRGCDGLHIVPVESVAARGFREQIGSRLLPKLERPSAASPGRPRVEPVHAMRTHLRSNLFPPVSAWYVPAAKKALKLYREGKLDRRIWLPTGRRISVAEAVQLWRLDRL